MRMKNPPRMAINWQRVISHLLLTEFISEREIADRIGCNQSTINRLRRGSSEEPSYSLGVLLLELAENAKKKEEVFDIDFDDEEWLE